MPSPRGYSDWRVDAIEKLLTEQLAAFEKAEAAKSTPVRDALTRPEIWLQVGGHPRWILGFLQELLVAGVIEVGMRGAAPVYRAKASKLREVARA